MASAVDSGKGEATFVGLEVSGDLSTVLVGLPVSGGIPSECADPVLRADGRDGTVNVSRVVKHSDLALELLVDPLGALLSDDVVPILASAEIPSLHIVRNVQGLSYYIQIQVVEKS